MVCANLLLHHRYYKPGIGNLAINDSFLLESCIYNAIKKHFRKESYYVELLELMHEVVVVAV